MEGSLPNNNLGVSVDLTRISNSFLDIIGFGSGFRIHRVSHCYLLIDALGFFYFGG